MARVPVDGIDGKGLPINSKGLPDSNAAVGKWEFELLMNCFAAEALPAFAVSRGQRARQPFVNPTAASKRSLSCANEL
jgi:hypothetical protein